MKVKAPGNVCVIVKGISVGISTNDATFLEWGYMHFTLPAWLAGKAGKKII